MRVVDPRVNDRDGAHRQRTFLREIGGSISYETDHQFGRSGCS